MDVDHSSVYTLETYIRCTVFGGLTMSVDGRPVNLGTPKQQLVLATLLVQLDSRVSTDFLCDVLWPDDPPSTARKNIQLYISRLRKIFRERLRHVGYGYELHMQPEECDLAEFIQALNDGRAALNRGDAAAAADHFARSIRLWGAGPDPGIARHPQLFDLWQRLSERHLAAVEDWADLEIGRGNHGLVLPVLEEHGPRHLMRERLVAQFMRALDASGRTSEAMARFDTTRRALAAEMGTSPGALLTGLHEQLLKGVSIAPGRPRATTGVAGLAIGQLPRAVSDLIGRTGELQRLTVALTDRGGADIALVTGPIGVGKTAIAIHAAHLVREDFPDGQIVVTLGAADGSPRRQDDVLRELLAMVGVTEDLGAPALAPPRLLALWRSWVAEHRILLVLDGVTREDDVRLLAPGSGHSRALVTSRRQLRSIDSVERVVIDQLDEAAAMELLCRLVGSERIRAEEEAATELVNLCDGTPLAIRIVAARLDTAASDGIGEYADRMRDEARRLGELTFGDLDLRARYAAMYRRLARPERLAMGRVSRLAPVPHRASDLVAAIGSVGLAPQRALESLLDWNLLQPSRTGQPGYAMPVLARLFARYVAPRPALET